MIGFDKVAVTATAIETVEALESGLRRICKSYETGLSGQINSDVSDGCHPFG